MRNRILWCLAPAAIAVPCALVWWLVGSGLEVWSSVPLHTVLAFVGVLVSAAAVGVVLVSSALSQARLAGAAEADARRDLKHRQFLARLDHELKNPLTAILAATASGDDEASALVSAQARRMGMLITDLRKLADLSSAPMERERVDLEETVRDAVEAARSCVGDARSFTLAFPTAPWPLPRVVGDADLLYSAIQNVVLNAVKYSGEGDSIEVRASHSEDGVSIEVADTGIGVPEAERESVWAELARGSNAAGRSGSGLGLALVRLVIERHGGHVRLTSREGVGTSVVMTLPLPDEAGAAPTRIPQPPL
ncbi:histidine kinase [Schaalia meyeri]|uniref:Sensor-like histidine kinase SenX3 n=1 Tax=Schaalia meyeri TaxID=52773 RepID=A0AAP9Y7W4_9ACTO|nr:HAMP domain-containing sensor histidine kinase [Schaalia meyeri]AKU65560.1 histidine kinase [Schaalia meyeri]OFQ23658.1 two-component sensor histidine kinase [Actinomyces sp. HMSC062G12]QQC43740.1 HAMP domain-containing histidine kinase [Schaalia meyeri]SDS14104.1 Signal transduction histidine kinase [Schaalia meyeri]